jgi:hypothetical protein
MTLLNELLLENKEIQKEIRKLEKEIREKKKKINSNKNEIKNLCKHEWVAEPRYFCQDKLTYTCKICNDFRY